MAPFSGHIGRKEVSIGDLIGPDTGSLASITTVDPMHVVFDIPERLIVEAARLRKGREER